MEALTAVAVAALTVYDMCKAIDKTMAILDIRLLEKTGGKSGIGPLNSRAIHVGGFQPTACSSPRMMG